MLFPTCDRRQGKRHSDESGRSKVDKQQKGMENMCLNCSFAATRKYSSPAAEPPLCHNVVLMFFLGPTVIISLSFTVTAFFIVFMMRSNTHCFLHFQDLGNSRAYTVASPNIMFIHTKNFLEINNVRKAH